MVRRFSRRSIIGGIAALAVIRSPALAAPSLLTRIGLDARGRFVAHPNGSDTLGAGSDTDPWQTPTGMWNNIRRKYDLNGYGADLVLVAATSPAVNIYPEFIASGQLPGQSSGMELLVANNDPFVIGDSAGRVVLMGSDPAYPLGVTLVSMTNRRAPISISGQATLAIQDLAVNSYTANADGIDVFRNSSLDMLGTIVFSNVGTAGVGLAIGWGCSVKSFCTEIAADNFGTIGWLNVGSSGVFLNDWHGNAPRRRFTVNEYLQWGTGFVIAEEFATAYMWGFDFRGKYNPSQYPLGIGPAYLLQNGGNVIVDAVAGQLNTYLPGTVTQAMIGNGNNYR